MSETTTVTEPQITQRPHEVTLDSSKLAGSIFGVEVSKQQEQEPTVQAPVTQPSIQAPQEPIVSTPIGQEPTHEEVVDEQTFLKSKFGWESEEDALNEIKELRALKDKKTEFKYENDDSRKFHEAFISGKIDEAVSIWNQRKQIEATANLDVTKPSEASEVIRLALQLKHPELDKSEVSDLFNEQYAKPILPKQPDDMTDEDYAIIKQDWQQRCDSIDRKVVRDAKMAKPELSAFNTKLVLPDIQKSEPSAAPAFSQEEIDAMARYDEHYKKSVDDSLKTFDGFSVSVKNEDVGLPETKVSYGIPETERESLASELKSMADYQYDANVLFAPFWVNEDKTLNVRQMAEDRYLLANKAKVFEKIANESATKAIEAFIKSKKQITVTQTPTVTTPLGDEKTQMDSLRDKVFG